MCDYSVLLCVCVCVVFAYPCRNRPLANPHDLERREECAMNQELGTNTDDDSSERKVIVIVIIIDVVLSYPIDIPEARWIMRLPQSVQPVSSVSLLVTDAAVVQALCAVAQLCYMVVTARLPSQWQAHPLLFTSISPCLYSTVRVFPLLTVLFNFTFLFPSSDCG